VVMPVRGVNFEVQAECDFNLLFNAAPAFA